MLKNVAASLEVVDPLRRSVRTTRRHGSGLAGLWGGQALSHRSRSGACVLLGSGAV